MSSRRFRPPVERMRPRRGLNPGLVARLEATIGPVEIANAGEPARFGPPTSDPRTGRPRVNLIEGGEEYVLTCPFCNGRKKLYVGHRLGTTDPDLGQTLDWLAVCFRTDCLADPELRREFRARVLDPIDPKARAVVFALDESAAHEPEAGPREVGLPGDCVLLDALEESHPARRYLERRGYDPDELARTHFLAYCRSADSSLGKLAELVTGRLIIPVFEHGELINWQARRLDAEEKLKYVNLPGGKLHRFLYNWDAAQRQSVVVLVEGVTSVWRLGPEGVALFGKSLSEHQEQRLLEWRRKTGGQVILIPDADDPDAAAKWQKIAETLRPRFGDDLCVHKLPAGKQPSDFDREALRRRLAAEVPGFPA